MRIVRTRLDYLDEAWRQFQTAHVTLVQGTEDQAQLTEHEHLFEEIENMFITASAIMRERIVEIDDANVMNHNGPSEEEGGGNGDDDGAAANADGHQQQPGPQINQNQAAWPLNLRLPWQFPIENVWGEFHGDKKKWQAFHDSFKTSVYENVAIPPVRKFQLLRSSLKGSAYKALGEWQICERNFEPAWQRLVKLYDDQYATSKELLSKLYGLKKMDAPNGMKLQIISNVAQEVSRQLGAMGHPVEHFDLIFVHEVQSKLDHASSMAWDVKRGINNRPTLSELTDFLDARAKALCHAYHVETTPQQNKNAERKRPQTGQGNQANNKRFKSTSNSSPAAVKTEPQQCAACSEKHLTRKCPEFIKLNLTNRKDKVHQANLCYNCLGHGHTIKDCKAGKCNRCDKKHNSLLCAENPNNRNVNADQVASKKKRAQKSKKDDKEKAKTA